MRPPRPAGTAIDGNRFRGWLNKFGTYWSNPTRAAIEEWLEQFSERDRDLAARILDAVLFLDQQHIYNKYRTLLASLPGWNDDPAQRGGRWAFVPFTSSAGESGDTMTHWFRTATGMTLRKYNELFCHRSDLVSKKFGPDDTIVLIDDFAGTGGQASKAWSEYFSELVAGGPRVFLMLICSTATAAKRISEETEMHLHSAHTLQGADNFFSSDCAEFTAQEKNRLLEYCRKAKSSEPKGYGDCGLLLVFSYKSPNNSLPILHATARRWTPLFPRRGE